MFLFTVRWFLKHLCSAARIEQSNSKTRPRQRTRDAALTFDRANASATDEKRFGSRAVKSARTGVGAVTGSLVTADERRWHTAMSGAIAGLAGTATAGTCWAPRVGL